MATWSVAFDSVAALPLTAAKLDVNRFVRADDRQGGG
jgi:hypothetical protein